MPLGRAGSINYTGRRKAGQGEEFVIGKGMSREAREGRQDSLLEGVGRNVRRRPALPSTCFALLQWRREPRAAFRPANGKRAPLPTDPQFCTQLRSCGE